MPEDEAHVWYVLLDDLRGTDYDRYASGLTEDERARHGRYVFEANRREYLATRALARATLSRYANVGTAEWVFRVDPYGKPWIDHPPALLAFNLSNTPGLVACVVASPSEVGVDVEDTLRSGETVEIADRFFSRAEAEALRSLPSEKRRERFFVYWTLKEAYIKARGLGLSLPLDQFTFHVSGPAPRIEFHPGLNDDPAAWEFETVEPTPRHRLSVARRRRGTRFVFCRTIP
jgi:4'-phosphopantetheinyl transferase